MKEVTNNMKRIIHILAIVAASMLCMSACTKQGTAQAQARTEEHRLQVITTIFPQYDFARQIGKDKADVTMLLKPGAESHSYEPSPKDIKDIQNCDLFIYTGGENDAWVENILASMEGRKPDILRLIDCVDTVTEEIVEGMEGEHHHEEIEESAITQVYDHDHAQADHSHNHEGHEDDALNHEGHDHEEEVDEHVWTSPVNAIAIVNEIARLMMERDPDNAGAYAENRDAYVGQLRELDQAFRQVVDTGIRRTVLFGDRFPFRYFADAYGLDYYAAFPGCSAQTEASAATIAFLIDKVRQERIPVVCTIELSNGKIADAICEATGAQKRTMYSCHNVTKKQWETGITYLSMMMENAQTLRTALN